MKAVLIAPPRGWHATDLLRAASARDQVACVEFQQLESRVENGKLSVGGGEVRNLLDFDAVIVRTMPPGSLEQVVTRMDILHLCEANGVRVVNPPRAIETAVDKYLATARLQAEGLTVPDTWVGERLDQARQAFARLGGDVVCKPIFGSLGRGIFRISDVDLAERALATLARLQSTIYLQRYVPHHGFDWRVLVIGERTWGMRRVHTDDWRTNIHRGAHAEPLQVDPDARKIALRAARAVGARWAGVDLLPGQDGKLYVLEVNAAPGWRALAATTRDDIAAAMWDDLRDYASITPR